MIGRQRIKIAPTISVAVLFRLGGLEKFLTEFNLILTSLAPSFSDL
jgi:hypothetical protein